MAAKELGARMKKFTIPHVDPDKPYPMTKPKLGKAVIVNNVHSEQTGSRADVEALKETYEKIGLEVEVHNDCDKTKMGRIKRNILRNEMHEDSNCFVLSVICHGNNNGYLLDKDKKRAWVTEDILSDLSLVETLVGKPKILVLQACRGSESSSGTSYLGEAEDMDPVTLPDKSDMFVAYATVPGYRAHAGDEDGSAFIQAFSAYLERHYETHDLDAIYSMVNQYMAGVEQGESADKQVSEKRSSLRFPLRFSEFKGKYQGISVAGTKPSPPAGAKPTAKQVTSADRQMSEKTMDLLFDLLETLGKSQGIPKGKPVVGSPPPPPASTSHPLILSLPPAGAQQSQRTTQLNIRLLSTYDMGLVYWGETTFTVMETGHIVLWGKTSKESPAALHMFLQDSEGFKKVREVNGFCEHVDIMFLEPVKVKDQEFLALSCYHCRKIRLYHMISGKVTTAFYNHQYYPWSMSAGEEGIMYVVCNVKGVVPVLNLNTEQIPFTGPIRTIWSGMERLYSMVHIPAPHNLLVLSSSKDATKAMSSITGEKKWQLRGKAEGRECHPRRMIFSQDHQALLVADGDNRIILVLDPRDGSVINNIQLDDEMGAIFELCIQKQKLILHHANNGKVKVSFFFIK